MNNIKTLPSIKLDIANYKDYIASMEHFGALSGNPKATVVIVAYCTNERLLKCLDSLEAQTFKEFEVIVVDNGGNDEIHARLREYNLLYVKMNANYNLSFGRNVGASLARSNIVCSIDDDAIVDRVCIEKHYRYHSECNIFALNGRACYLKHPCFTEFATNYDLGPKVINTIVDLEGNSSWNRSKLIAIGGFDANIFGGEGRDLCVRYLSSSSSTSPHEIIYVPDAVIYHDYADTFEKFSRKALMYGRHFGAKIFTEGKGFLYIFRAVALKSTFIPRFRFYWRVVNEKKHLRKRFYVPLLMLGVYREFIFRIGEVQGYLREKRRCYAR